MQAIEIKSFLNSFDELKISKNVPFNDSLKPHEVIVSIKAAGLNFFDGLMVLGKYQYKPKRPFILGTEYSGVVIKVGSSVKKFSIGDEVFGTSRIGAFAEKIKIHESQIWKKNIQMTFEQAAAFPMVYATSYDGLALRGKVTEKDTVLIHAAAGGVGLAAVQISKALGAKVIGTCGSQAKCEVVLKAGADYCINYSTEDWINKVKQITKNKGVNVVYDSVGLVKSTKVMAFGGRYLVVGFAGGIIPKVPLNHILLKNLKFIGVYLGGEIALDPTLLPRILIDLNKLFDQGKISPLISRIYSLEQTSDALKALASRKTYGKVVLITRNHMKSKL